MVPRFESQIKGLLNTLKRHTRECLTIDIARSFRAQDVVELLCYLFAVRGYPAYIRSDNSPEFISKAVKKWLKVSGVKTLYTTRGSPWENGHIEPFNGKFRDKLLNREFFLNINELRYVVDRWQMDYNHYRLHSGLGYMAPAAFAMTCQSSDSATLHRKIEAEDYEEILSY